jgi:hypothetical protein
MAGSKEPMASHMERDLNVFLLGVLCANSERSKTVLNTMPEGSFTGEIEEIVRGFRIGNYSKLHAWLCERRAIVEKGTDSVSVACQALLANNRILKVRQICQELNYASSVENATLLIERLEKALTELKSIK